MKNLKAKLPLLTLLLGIGIVFFQSAFTSAPAKLASTYWRYDDTDPNNSRDGSNYTQITNPDSPTCPTGSDVPCVLEVPDNVTSQTQLTDYLEDNFATAHDVNISPIAIKKKLGD